MRQHGPYTKAGTSFTALGLVYDFRDSTATRRRRESDDIMRARLRRFGQATRSPQERARHAASLVLPLFIWAAPFVDDAEETVAWTKEVVRSVFVPMPAGASPQLAQHYLRRWKADPQVAADSAVLRMLYRHTALQRQPPRWEDSASLEFLAAPLCRRAPAVQAALGKLDMSLEEEQLTWRVGPGQTYCTWQILGKRGSKSLRNGCDGGTADPRCSVAPASARRGCRGQDAQRLAWTSGRPRRIAWQCAEKGSECWWRPARGPSPRTLPWAQV